MAVKQNNNEIQQDASDGATGGKKSSETPAGGGGGGGVGGGAGTTTGGTMPPKISEEGVEILLEDLDTNSASTTTNNNSNNTNKNGLTNLRTVLHNIEQLHHQDQTENMLLIYKRILYELANMKVAKSAEDLKRCKEEIIQVGAFLASDKRYLMYYLTVVYQMITQSANEPPSYAVAIVFHLFQPNVIIEAVQALLEQNVKDASIRKTVGLLCEWIRVCNFCQNLNLWVMALLTGLREQGKYRLLDEIAMDNIEKLFMLFLFPALRPKAAPIVFHMLSNINQNPEIFHKILPKIPGYVHHLKTRSGTTDEASSEALVCMQKLIDITNALMLRFNDYDELYAPLKTTLQMYEPSHNYVAIARAMYENSLPTLGRTNARVGLVNLGNTCYMNSVLQALAMTSDFSREILLIESGSLLLSKVQQQIALMHYSLRHELTPSRVLNATRPPGFTPGLQQDSSEFLGYLLELLHEQEIHNHQNHLNEEEESSPSSELCQVIPYNSKDRDLITTSSTSSSSGGSKSLKPLQKQTGEPLTLSTIDKTFAGKLSTTYKCLDCGWESRNEDSFRELQLSFPDDKDDLGATNYSVQDLIEYYCSPEKLDGDNQYFCPRCKKLCDAERRIGIIQAPRNLILTLKQFKYDQKYHFRTKLMHKVFHDESVTVKLCSTDSLLEMSNVHYDLYAGVVHAGYSMDSGHYFTFAADQSKHWYKFNDSLVTSSQPEEMHSLTSPNTPYILFYQMCGRSNDTSDTAVGCSSMPVEQVPITTPLTLEELPRRLRDYVKQDNRVYSDELKMQQPMKRSTRTSGNNFITRTGYEGDDDDDRGPPPSAGGCGGNGLGMNMNRFVY
ncbi:uncharacterized protein Dwil_GK15746 [Drosophila willistoni]|uniref:USP domain-containing protein n=1 Tax=Drosophila willistoni TaxID=7260 RepID=B4MRI2_DROWI|nr:ubiquitin carboxyl-terminal hydrolase 38 [Drosophila willistoni]XP_023030746.1 ubiquitin carboxyl-terminal hydrolase 38 [Drosophila willistoni]EDW74721.1 uncharacterized protein Dwil_GK15746 [Drosophila willistoni]